MFINEGSKEGNHDEVFWVTLEFLWLGFRLAHITQGSRSPTALPISLMLGIWDIIQALFWNLWALYVDIFVS